MCWSNCGRKKRDRNLGTWVTFFVSGQDYRSSDVIDGNGNVKNSPIRSTIVASPIRSTTASCISFWWLWQVLGCFGAIELAMFVKARRFKGTNLPLSQCPTSAASIIPSWQEMCGFFSVSMTTFGRETFVYKGRWFMPLQGSRSGFQPKRPPRF